MDPNKERIDEHLDDIDAATLAEWEATEMDETWLDTYLRDSRARVAILQAECEQIIEEQGW